MVVAWEASLQQAQDTGAVDWAWQEPVGAVVADKEARCAKNPLVLGQQTGAEAVVEAKVAPWMWPKEGVKLE